MASNINPITGIRYGVVRLDSLKDWVIDEFNEVDGTVDYDSDETILAGQRIYYVDRETVKMHLELFRLGGAYNVMVCMSEHVTKGNLCSPCVPNAVDLDAGVLDEFDADALVQIALLKSIVYG